MFFSRSIDLFCVFLHVFPGFRDGGFHSVFQPEKPQGLDTDLDDILHPEEKEEARLTKWPF